MENSHVTVLEIDLNAVKINLNYFKSKLYKKTKIVVVVKAFGYGSDAVEIAKFLENSVDYFAVAYLNEGVTLRKGGIKTPILVLHPQKCNLEKIIEHRLEPNIYSVNLLKRFIEISRILKLENYPIHLKFNTGLNRLGFTKNDISEISSLINNQNEIIVKSIFSHIAASEDLNERVFTLQQINIFNSISKEVINLLNYTPFKHMLNTSGVLNYATEAQFDMVRLGIGLYGFGNDEKHTKKLKSVLTLTSIISQIQTIRKGETVGYNRAYKATTTIKTATIPIGHADGISRKLGNSVGYVYINNKKAVIVGNVCMDMIMVDVTNIVCNEGDEVIIYKNQQHIEALAKASNTIPYELLTAISQRVRRVLKSC
ncbi:alanine racemase [Lutibacter profundi]|uniref:Alanine racemase n=1 Tax=Lutibacter profundi TaxID=1622118 RepID=A0A0X8G8W2_9FLAO|nr:alanine racemase [Lutibacter profundi]AMC12238.1 alanine racemase [Lutibacter profundi]